jgi:quinol monooxygenase YgiN
MLLEVARIPPVLHASDAALKAHSVALHMPAYRARVNDLVRGMDLRVLPPA